MSKTIVITGGSDGLGKTIATFLQKENICLLFEQLIKLSNNEELNNNSNFNNKDFIKGILHNFTNSLRVLSIPSNDYCKGILLSKYKQIIYWNVNP